MRKIKALLEKLITRHEYSRCYTSNEYTGKAVFLMCKCDDMDCPYNVNKYIDKESIVEEEAEGGE